MKNIVFHFRNYQKQRDNNRLIEKSEEYCACNIKKIEKEIAALELKIKTAKTILLTSNTHYTISNTEIECGAGYRVFIQKLEAIFADLGIKEKDREAFAMGICQQLQTPKKPAFYYYCTTDPRKSTIVKPDKPQNFVAINLEMLEIEDRLHKIKKILQCNL